MRGAINGSQVSVLIVQEGFTNNCKMLDWVSAEQKRAASQRVDKALLHGDDLRPVAVVWLLREGESRQMLQEV